jgi:uncharacterized protein (TIGR03067 family)
VRPTFAAIGSLLALFVFGAAGAAPVPKEDPARAELARLNGTWEMVSHVQAGVERPVEGAGITITFKNGEFTWGDASSPGGRIASIDPSKTPKELDYTYGAATDKKQKAIYQLDGDTFVDCFYSGEMDGERPKEFKSTKENGLTVIKYKRLKKKD